MSKHFAFLIAITLVCSCSQKEGSLFKNPTPKETGIHFENALNDSDALNILDYLYFYNGGGVAIGDINTDGLPDIYLSGNRVKNKLYLNKGNMTFEDITEKAGVSGRSDWNTGAIMGDVNGDGLLDIYVCAVVGINGFNGYNELFINNGDTTFTESARAYGLDFDSYSSSAAFLDYDGDGDLDIYLLNHAVHTQESFGKADLRLQRNEQSGDKLLRNDGDTFTDVSEQAGIFGGITGYGLGVSVADFNQDGNPDIYVGNDFHEDDYYYINNGDGTFIDKLRDYFGHTSRFSMGNDAADIDHDGWPDLISLDMLPEKESVLKASDGDGDLQTQQLRVDRYGYHYQFSRNMLHMNRKGHPYLETALMSGVAATDWSWSALFADYDQDGEQDLFISNGIPKRPNDLDYINFVSDEKIKQKINDTKLVDQEALDLMPDGKTYNYIFQGGNPMQFENRSGDWTVKDSLISGATAWGDLDNDGDLDLVVNNLNSPVSLYVNKTDDTAHYLKLKFKYDKGNQLGIGTKVYSYHNKTLQYKELYTARGFQSSSEPIIHFGYGKTAKIDSLRIVWPNGTTQTLTDIQTDQTLTLVPENTIAYEYPAQRIKKQELFKKVPNNIGISFEHREDRYTDFNRQKLIPYQVSDRGPATAIGDLNSDGKTDVFFGGSKFAASRIFVQTDSAFVPLRIDEIAKDSVKEDVAAAIVDINGNGKNDLYIGSGGGDFFDQMTPLLDSYYSATDSSYQKAPLPETFQNASVVAPYDFDGDGDMDLFVGNQAMTNDFGSTPYSALLENDKGVLRLTEQPELNTVGMVTDAIWNDFNGDGQIDLIVVGEWMAPVFFKNTNGRLKKTDVGIDRLNGLWQAIQPYDIDGDGDTDYLLGNWGENTKFKASEKRPLHLYYGDLDDNGQTETITAINKNGGYYPIETLGGLASQLIFLKKRFLRNKDFAGKTIDALFTSEELEKAEVLEVHQLRSGYLKNKEGTFSFVPFPKTLQIAPLTTFAEYDFDGDGKTEILTAGNYFGVKPYHGRFDSFPGALIKTDQNIVLGDMLGLELSHKAVRDLNIISFQDKSYLLVTINNQKAEVYQIR